MFCSGFVSITPALRRVRSHHRTRLADRRSSRIGDLFLGNRSAARQRTADAAGRHRSVASAVVPRRADGSSRRWRERDPSCGTSELPQGPRRPADRRHGAEWPPIGHRGSARSRLARSAFTAAGRRLRQVARHDASAFLRSLRRGLQRMRAGVVYGRGERTCVPDGLCERRLAQPRQARNHRGGVEQGAGRSGTSAAVAGPHLRFTPAIGAKWVDPPPLNRRSSSSPRSALRLARRRSCAPAAAACRPAAP